METHDFINIYIKNLVKEVEELTKSKVLLAAKEEFKNAETEELQKKLTTLEENSAKDRDDVAQTWQLALKEKDEEVVQSQHEMSELRRKLQVETNKSDGLHSKIEELNRELDAKGTKVEELNKELEAKEKVINDLNAVIQSFEKNNKPQEEKKAVTKKTKKDANATLLIE